jgi:ankyrin repeat protein
MATGPVDDEIDAFQRVQEYYQRRESKLKLKMVDIQRIPKQSRGRRKAVISLDHSTNLPAFKSIVSVEPEGLLGEYFALKVLTVIPRTEDVYLDELQGELRRASLPVTLAVYLNNQYIVGPKGLLVGTSPKCNVRLPLESGLKEQHFRVRAKVDKDLNEGETAGYFVESCVGEGDIAEVDDQHVPGFESYDPSNPVPSLNVPSIALSSSKVFISGQFVWQVVSLPTRTVASLQAFDAVRKENLSKLRSVLESRDNKLRGEGAPNDLESLIFDINGEEKVGEEYSNSQDNREERKSSSTRTNVLLHIAVQKENLEMVQLLLKKGADPNSFGGTHRRTALHYAAESDNVGILSTLLNHGGDVELKDINALPPVTLAKSHKVRKLLLNSVLLSSAALEGLYEEVECYLRQPNVTPNVLGLRHKSPLQLASIAGHHQVVGLLLGREANVDQCGGTHGRSALHYAAYHGHTDTVRVLVDHRANMELKDIEGNTAMNLCTQADVLHLLSKETMPTLCDAVQSGDLEAAERLLLVNQGKEGYIEQRDSQMNTPLHIACRRGQLEMVRLLKKYGTNVNIAGGMERVTPICMAAKEGFAEVVEFLIGVGAEIEGENSSGETFSVREMVEDLIERCNRDLQQLRFTGRPPSHWDCNIYINRQTSLTCLETAGPIQMCQDTIDRLERVYELLFTGPERLMRAFETRDLHRFRELLKGDSPVSPNCILLPRENITALAYICEKNEYDYAKVLIEAGAEVCKCQWV